MALKKRGTPTSITIVIAETDLEKFKRQCEAAINVPNPILVIPAPKDKKKKKALDK